jgi:hypothetical protein
LLVMTSTRSSIHDMGLSRCQVADRGMRDTHRPGL